MHLLLGPDIKGVQMNYLRTSSANILSTRVREETASATTCTS